MKSKIHNSPLIFFGKLIHSKQERLNKTKTLFLAITLLMVACHPQTENNPQLYEDALLMDMVPTSAMNEEPMKEMVKFAPPIVKDDALEEETKTENASTSKNKKIIKDGEISIKVEKIKAAKKRLDDVVKNFDAYYEKEEFENEEYKTGYTLKVRIPSKLFEKFLNSAEKVDGEIISKSIHARDITAAYTDNEIRLNSKKLFRKRYNEILAKASKVVDILAIEENIRILQEEIESQEGTLKYMDDQVAYSTLDITLFHLKEIKIPNEAKETFWQLVKHSLGNGCESIVSFILWGLKQWPLVMLISIALISFRWYLRKRKKLTREN